MLGKLLSGITSGLMTKLKSTLKSYSAPYFGGVNLDEKFDQVLTIELRDSIFKSCSELTVKFSWPVKIDFSTPQTIEVMKSRWDVLSASEIHGQGYQYTCFAVPKGAADEVTKPITNSSVIPTLTKVTTPSSTSKFSATKISPALKGDLLRNLIFRMNLNSFEEKFGDLTAATFIYQHFEGTLCKTWKSFASSSKTVKLQLPAQFEFQVIEQEPLNWSRVPVQPKPWTLNTYLQLLCKRTVIMRSNIALTFLGCYKFESGYPDLDSLGKVLLIGQDYIPQDNDQKAFTQTFAVI